MSRTSSRAQRGTEKKYEDTGRLDHIAFAATDVEGVRRRLQSRGVKFRESIVPPETDASESRQDHEAATTPARSGQRLLNFE